MEENDIDVCADIIIVFCIGLEPENGQIICCLEVVIDKKVLSSNNKRR